MGRNYKAKPARGTSVRKSPISGGSNRTPSGMVGNWQHGGRRDVIPTGSGASAPPTITPVLTGKNVHSDGTNAVIVTSVTAFVGQKGIILHSSDGDAVGNSISAITDAGGNTWARVCRITDPSAGAGSGMITEIWCADITVQVNSGTNCTVAATSNHSVTHFYLASSLHTGVPAAGLTATAKGASDTQTVTATVTAASVGDLVIGATHWGPSLSAAIGGATATGAGHNLNDDISDFFLFINEQATQYKDATVAVGQALSSSDTAGTNPNWQMVVAVFPFAAGAGAGSGGSDVNAWVRGGNMG